MQTAAAQSPLFSDEDIQQMVQQYERRVQIAAAMAQLQSQTAEQAQAQAAPAAMGVPDFPPEPDFIQTMVTIPKRYFEEAVKRAPDSAGIMAAIPRLLTTDEGRKLLDRLKDAVINKKDDPALFADLMKFIVLGGTTDYGSLLLGVTSDAGLGTGIIGLTGVAIPTKGNGKVKWFSGLERSKGVVAEASTSFLIGRKIAEPQNLTGQFYGYHLAAPLGPVDVSSNIYFDTSNDLHYEGFIATFGIGFAIGSATLWGWELVTSD